MSFAPGPLFHPHALEESFAVGPFFHLGGTREES